MMRMLLLLAALVPAVSASQGGASNTPRFRYVLPEGFRGWACTDFGVEGAPPLKRDGDMYVIEPRNESIVPTSSLPGLFRPPFPAELIRMVNGEARTLAVDEIQQRGEHDTNSPVARYCLFFGSTNAAARFPRPPTLSESRLRTDPVLPLFEFSRGDLCDFHDVSRVCLAAKDVTRRRVDQTIILALRALAKPVTGTCDDFEGIVVRYEADWAELTHSSSRGPRFAFAEVRREDAKGTKALVTWSSTQGGSAAEVAERFGRELAGFLRQAASRTCTK